MKEEEDQDDIGIGVKNGAILYGLGALITTIFYFGFGWNEGTPPPTLSALVIPITLIAGFYRFFATLYIYITKRSKKAKGEFIIHVIVAILVIVFLIWARNQT